MSYITAVINSAQVERTTVLESGFGPKIKGEFQWDLPISLPTMANNYWGVRVRKATVTNRIISSNWHPELYGFDIYHKDSDAPIKIIVSDIIGIASSPYEISALVNNLIPKNVPVSLLVEGKSTVLKVGEDSMVILGNKLAESLGLKYGGSSFNQYTSIFNPGEYKGDYANFTHIYNNRLGIIYIALDIIRPGIFGKSFKPIICTITKSGLVCEESSNFYYDLIQCPVTNMTISFLDEQGNVLDFCPQTIDDFLFSIELEFKKLVLYD
jgi:hypothetical protein